MTKIVLSIANLKHAAFASEETHCFNATLLVDGKRVGVISNEGHGGPDMIHFDKGAPWTHKSLNEAVKASYPVIDCAYMGVSEEHRWMDPCVETVVGDLVNEALAEKQITAAVKRDQKKWVGVVEGKLLTWKVPKTASDDAVRAGILKRHPTVKFTRDMTIVEAIKAYRDCGAIR